MKLPKLSKRAKIVLSFILFVVFLYFIYSFIYAPRNTKIEELDNKISSLRSKIDDGRRIAARLDVLRKEYQELTEKMEFMEVLLPKEKDIPEFLVMLQETMDEFNIDFTNFSPQNLLVDRDSIYAQLPIRLTFTADYFETIRFIDRLENYPSIVEVRNIKLNPVGENLVNVYVDMSMFNYVLVKGN